MILFVNLQIVINEGKGVVSSFSNAYAQHMTREAGDNCYLAGFGWYLIPANLQQFLRAIFGLVHSSNILLLMFTNH